MTRGLVSGANSGARVVVTASVAVASSLFVGTTFQYHYTRVTVSAGLIVTLKQLSDSVIMRVVLLPCCVLESLQVSATGKSSVAVTECVSVVTRYTVAANGTLEGPSVIGRDDKGCEAPTDIRGLGRSWQVPNFLQLRTQQSCETEKPPAIHRVIS